MKALAFPALLALAACADPQEFCGNATQAVTLTLAASVAADAVAAANPQSARMQNTAVQARAALAAAQGVQVAACASVQP